MNSHKKVSCAVLWLLPRVALDALEHRDVAEVDWVSERFVRFVTGLALSIGESTKIDRMLDIHRQ